MNVFNVNNESLREFIIIMIIIKFYCFMSSRIIFDVTLIRMMINLV